MRVVSTYSRQVAAIFLRGVLILFLAACVANALAAPDPSAVYCVEMGYTLEGGECLFPDGNRCEPWAFYRGECGARWSYCEQHGGLVETRVESKGSWTAQFAACLFDDGSECGEQAFMKGECKPTECIRWSGSECAEVIESEDPAEPPAPEEEPEESAKEYAERTRREMGLGPAAEARHTSFGYSFFKRGNPPLSRQVLRPGDLLTTDLCSADKMGCDWDDHAEISNPFVLHQARHKDLDKNKALLRFNPRERFQFQMDGPGNSLITFTCRGDGGEEVRKFVTAVTVDPAATRVYFDQDGIQVMTADGVKKYTPDSTYMFYMLKCKMVEKGKEPIDRISSGLFDRFGFIMCAADWMDCDWVDEPTISDSGVVVQYNHKHVENPAFRKFPEERFDFQTIGEGSSEITFSCMNEQGEELRSHTVTLNVGQERWAEIIEYKKKEDEEVEEETTITRPLCQVYEGSGPQACDDCRIFDRLDYVYVKESGGGLKLRPIKAEVLRDWKYMDKACDPPIETDLSDHFPLKVTFAVEGPLAAGVKNELTVLNFNAHLFYGMKGDIAEQFSHEVMIYQDEIRKRLIVDRLREQDADIVGLQEAWAPIVSMEYFSGALKDLYPYQYYVPRNPGLRGTSGAMLLSKLPLKNKMFREFPIHYPTNIVGMNIPDFAEVSGGKMPQDAMATKGVLTADVELQPGGPAVRIGVSHALTNQEIKKSKWSQKYVRTGITSFKHDGDTYIFGLKQFFNEAYIRRLHDYSYKFQGDLFHDAGWEPVYKCKESFNGCRWDSDFVSVVSFELNGHPYLFGLKGWSDMHTPAVRDFTKAAPFNKAIIARINDDPSTGWNWIYEGPWSSLYRAETITSFELNGHPYIFGVKLYDRGMQMAPKPFREYTNEAFIRRINDDPSTGWTEVHKGWWDSSCRAAISFELQGHPYLFVMLKDGRASIVRINDDPATGWTTLYTSDVRSGDEPATITSFELNGHPYIFSLDSRNFATIRRINDDPATGWVNYYNEDMKVRSGTHSYVTVRSFELNGHPYLFSLKAMLGEWLGHLPGEAYLSRIKDNAAGWDQVFNLPHIQIIIDETLRDGMPAIMMGDFNVHLDHYDNMDRMFETFGAVDAYTAVHGGETLGSETIDLCNNTLTQVFKQDSSSPGIMDVTGHEFFLKVASGAVCYERKCEVCDGGEEQAEPSEEDHQVD